MFSIISDKIDQEIPNKIAHALPHPAKWPNGGNYNETRQGEATRGSNRIKFPMEASTFAHSPLKH